MAEYNVFGVTYTCVEEKINSDNLAEIEFDERKIAIAPGQSKYNKMHTILHELGHALFKRVSFKQAIEPQIEESIVDTYATMIMENFYIKNKK